MEILKSKVIFLSIILITGALTVTTDLKSKKIYNYHLIIAALLGLAAIVYTAVWLHENILFHMINGLIALMIGACFYSFSIWRGGDAKLFTLYAFLMPALEPDHVLLSSAINLFACSFIAGVIILTPFFIKDIASNYKDLINKLSSSEKWKTLFNAVKLTILSSWLFFPVYYYINITHIPALSLLVTYLMFNLSKSFLRKINLKEKDPHFIIVGSLVVLGFLIHLYLSPHSLAWPELPYFILRIGLFSALSACIYITLDLLKEYHDRVPFAPLLFIGCALSYTPFLTWVMRLLGR